MPDIVTTQVFQDGEKGITATKMNNIIADATIQPSFYSAKPSSSTLDPTDQLLELKSSGAYAQITGSQLVSSVSSQVNVAPQIWQARLRSFSAVGNPNFEVDQANVNAAITNAASGVRLADNWFFGKSGVTGTINSQVYNTAQVKLPGTNFLISRSQLLLQTGTTQATLAAGDFAYAIQTIEGPRLRELYTDVSSISVLAYSTTVAPLTFAVAIRDSSPTKSLVNLLTIPTAGVWTLLTIPNIPIFPSGNFSLLPGNIGYTMALCIACGTTYQAPATGTWQAGNYIGAAGMTNGLAAANNLYFAFVQHEPGSVCTTLMDLPFDQNLTACQRYFEKSYVYATKPGTSVANAGVVYFVPAGGVNPITPIRFKRTMAKAPTVTGYALDGTSGAVRDLTNSANRTISAVQSTTDAGFNGFVVSGGVSTIYQVGYDYTADTGW